MKVRKTQEKRLKKIFQRRMKKITREARTSQHIYLSWFTPQSGIMPSPLTLEIYFYHK